MSSISTLIYQFLRTKFGDLDWENGSVLRELIAEPVVALAEQATQAVNAVYNSLNITALLDNPEENADAIDALFTSMGLTEPPPTYSQGTVRLLLTSDASFTIPAGAAFYYNNTTLSVMESIEVTEFETLGYNTYAVDVPVTANVTGVSLSEGTELTWSIPNPSIYSATVKAAITGGSGTYTATQKINLIRQNLFPASLSCAEGFLKAINNYVEGLAVDCALATIPMQPNINLYVKTFQAPTTWTIPIQGQLVKNNQYTATCSGVGVSAVRRVVEGELISAAWLGRTLTLTYTGNATAVEVFGLPGLVTAQDALDRYTANTGVKVDVKTPNLLELEMQLPTSAPGVDAISQIVSAVNGSLLNTAGLGDATTQPILASAGNYLTGAGTYTLKDLLTGRKQASTATVNATPFMDVTTPYAIYATTDKIITQNV